MFRKLHDALVRLLNGLLMWLAFWRGGCRTTRSPLDLGQAQRILVVRLDGIGDVVMTTPFLRELRRNCPKACIRLVVSRAVVCLMAPCPYVDEVIGFDTAVRWPPRQVVLFFRAWALAARIRQSAPPDWVLMPRADVEAQGGGFLCLLTGATAQAVFSESTTPVRQWFNKGHDRFYSHVLTTPCAHEIDRNLSMLQSLGLATEDAQPKLWTTADARGTARAKAGMSERGDSRLVCVCPGAAQPEKLWPPEYFREVIAGILAETDDVRVVMLGGRREVQLAAGIARHFAGRVLDLSGKTTLIETAALLEISVLCIGNDTGALHIASAVDTAQIVVCGFPESGPEAALNSPQRFGPRWRTTFIQPAEALPPCTARCEAGESHCIRQVQPSRVLDAARCVLRG